LKASKMTKFFFKRVITGDESWIHLKGRHFRFVDSIKMVVKELLRALPREDSSTLLTEVGATSPTVCGYPRELLWRG
jgi:hypothetical protein